MRLSLLGLALAAGLAEQAAAPSPAATPAARREVRLHYTAQDREVGRYQYVPVRVAAGATRLTVAYAYDKAGGANVVDLGLFEPGSLDLGTSRLPRMERRGGVRDRGGHERGHAGLLAGPAARGRVARRCSASTRWGRPAWTSPSPPRPPPFPIPRPCPRSPRGPRDRCARGPPGSAAALHLHTRHSDGELSTAEVCRRAREAGHDFVVITDHNNTTHQLDARGRAGPAAHRGRGDHHPGRARERLRPRRLARPGGLPRSSPATSGSGTSSAPPTTGARCS